MQVRVLFFGAVKDIVGRPEEQLQLAPGTNIGALFDIYSRRFPQLSGHSRSLLFSLNQEFADRKQYLRDGDEVAFLPPVSGGLPDSQLARDAEVASERSFCRLTSEPIIARAMVEQVQQRADGAVVAFEGVVRDNSNGRATQFLEYEAYEPMAVAKMREICEDLLNRYPVDRIAIAHRVGRLEIGEISVAIVVSSEHRGPAFESCRAAIDRLKRIVPIWKKEHFVDGAVWVEGERTCAGAEDL